MSWDIERLMTIAGLDNPQSLYESYDEDEDDDEDDDVRRADAEAKKQGIKLPKVSVNVEDDMEHVAHKKATSEKESAADAAAKHEAKESAAKEKAEHAGKKPSPAAEKKETPAAEKKEESKSSEKKEAPAEDKEAPAEKKQRGKARSETSKTGILRAWIAANPNVKRSVAWAHAKEVCGGEKPKGADRSTPGISAAGFSVLYQVARNQAGLSKKREVKEAWIIFHPSIGNHVLHENTAIDQYQWVHFLNDNQGPMIFETEAEANAIANKINDRSNQGSIVERIDLED